MNPARYSNILFGLILSGLMTIMVSGISTLTAKGLVPGFGLLWLRAWLTSWALAFSMVLVMAPLTRKIVGKLVR